MPSLGALKSHKVTSEPATASCNPELVQSKLSCLSRVTPDIYYIPPFKILGSTVIFLLYPTRRAINT